MAIPTNLSVAAVSYNGTGIPLVGIVPSGTTQVNVTSNGTTTQDVTNYAYVQVNASVPNTYAAADEGKVVSNGALVAQTSKNISANGTVDTTLNNQVVVAVPNSYSASDEGKVVSNGALVAQGSDTVTTNGTVDTTLINSLTVNVPSGGGGTKTYIIRDGRVQSGYTFTLNASAVLTEETSGGVDFVKIYGTAKNKYEQIWTPLINVPSGATAFVLELAEVSGEYGWSWFGNNYCGMSAGTTEATGDTLHAGVMRTPFLTAIGNITKGIFVVGLQFDSQISIKIAISGNSATIGYIYIKNLYFIDSF